MKFKTVSGSTYEVDLDKKQIRRISSTHPPHRRQGQDGVWSGYDWITEVKVGRSVRIELTLPCDGRCLTTSTVTEIV